MPNLDEALANEPDTDSLSIDFADGEVLDDRVAALTSVERIHLSKCPDDLVLPRALLSLPKLSSLALRPRKGAALVVPALVAELRLTALDLAGADCSKVAWPRTLVELELRTETLEMDLRAIAGALPALQRLEVIGTTGVLPELGGLAHLVSLALRTLVDDLAALAALPKLEQLRFEASDLTRSLGTVAAKLPRLRELWVTGGAQGGGEVVGEVLAEIAELARLERLCLSCPIKTLPAALAKLPALRALELGDLPDRAIPEVVGALRGLEVLKISGHVSGLPASFANLTRLRELDLAGALNSGALLSRFDDIDKLKPLPRVLSQMTGLEVLALGQCGVFDLAPIAPLEKLRELRLEWSGMTTLEPLAGLVELEVLSLEQCDRVRDLSPLAKLTKLRELDLASCRPESLDALRALPALNKLDVSRIESKNLEAVYALDVELAAADEVLEQYKQRAALRALPPVGDIIGMLDSSQLSVVETALEQLATWAIASSTRDQSAIGAALGLGPVPPAAKRDDDEVDDDGDEADDGEADDDDDGEIKASARVKPSRALPPLDAALARHGARLSPKVLARTFRITFHTTNDDYDAAVRTAQEVAKRGDDEAQLLLVEAFEHANEYYDTGHRFFEDYAQDRLIEDVLPQLGGKALARLVAWCSDGHFGEDQMSSLFAPALERSRGEDREAVAKRLEKYIDYVGQYGDEDQAAQLFESFSTLEDAGAKAMLTQVRARVEDKLAAMRARTALEAELKSEQSARVSAALATMAALPKRDAKKDLQGALWNANKCDGLDATALRTLLGLWRELGHDGGLGEAIALAGRSGLIGRSIVGELGMAPHDIANRLRDEVLKLRTKSVGEIERASNRWNDEPETPETERAMAAVAERVAAQCAPLHAWANELDGITAAEGRAREVTAALARLGHFDREKLGVAIALLASCDGYVRPVRDDKDNLRGLADDLGQNADHEDLWPQFCQLARDLSKLQLRGKILERVLAQLIGIAINSKDESAVAALTPLIPEQVEWDILAFNLACLYASRGDRERMLRFTKRSLELGKSPAQFETDGDFAKYLGDPEFRAVLDASL